VTGRLRYRLALFDFDGTLADSRDWFLGVFDQVADRFGYRRLGPGDRERLRGMDTPAILRDLQIPLWKLPLIERHMRRLVTRDIDQVALFPGAAAMLDAVRAAGVEVAVVTSNTEPNVRRVLGPAAQNVQHFACGASLFGKAARVRAVLRATRTAPDAAILIGDEARDIAAARVTAVASGAVAWGYADADFLHGLGPTHFFWRMEDIAAALGGG
jgi:phosphoglycolate phosphatase